MNRHDVGAKLGRGALLGTLQDGGDDALVFVVGWLFVFPQLTSWLPKPIGW